MTFRLNPEDGEPRHLYCLLEPMEKDGCLVNFLNLPNWDVQPFQEDEDRYVVLARPLTACSACPTCGSVALVKNGTDESQVHDLPAQGKQVVIRVKRQRYLCRDCRASCSQPLPDVDE